MSVWWITPDEPLECKPDMPVVCIPVASADERLRFSISALLEHCDNSIPVIVACASDIVERVDGVLTGLGAGHVRGLATVGGETRAVNMVAQMSSPSDIVILVAGTRVAEGWLQGLEAAASSDSTIGTITAMFSGRAGATMDTGEDGVLGDGRVRPLDDPLVQERRSPDAGFDEAARRVSRRALKRRPRVSEIAPSVVYVRRPAWELAGGLNESLAPEEGLRGVAARLGAMGVVNVIADDTLVGWAPSEGRSPTIDSPIDSPANVAIVDDQWGPLACSLKLGRSALRRLSVTIDGRALVSAVGGTQTYIVELVLALARENDLSVRVLTPPDLSPRAAAAFRSVVDVELVSYEEAVRGSGLTDVVHRPQQVFTFDDFALLRLVGERIVIGQQDLISYHNHAYHPNIDAWQAFRRTTRLTLGSADQVVFFSEHARSDALREELLHADRATVAGIGLESIESAGAPGEPPPGLKIDRPFVLCIGADYAHKNRPFAIELLGALHELGWDGQLVLAGVHVPHGSSREREEELLAGDSTLADSVLDLGPVEEDTKSWLYANARALLYPTLYEGFGRIPVEAARAGLPCLFAAQASLAEIAGGAATLVPWDARASALAVLALLSDGATREAHLERLGALSVPSWKDVAHNLIAVYERALAMPPSDAPPRTWRELEREDRIAVLEGETAHLERLAQEYQDAYHALQARVGAGLPLIDEGGLLTPAQQRGLMRIAGRGRLGALALSPFGLLGGRGGDQPEDS